jgi:hypothetical protein
MGGPRDPRTERNGAVPKSPTSAWWSGTEMTAPNNRPSEATTSKTRSAVGEAGAGAATDETDDHIGDRFGAAQAATGNIAVTSNTAMQTRTTSRRVLIT